MNTKSIAFILIAAIVVLAGYQLWTAYEMIPSELSDPLIPLQGVSRVGTVLSFILMSLVGGVAYYIIDARGFSFVGAVGFFVLFVGACFPLIKAESIGEKLIEFKAVNGYEFCMNVEIEPGFRQEGGNFRIYNDRPQACQALEREVARDDWDAGEALFPSIKHINDWYKKQDSQETTQ